MKKFLFLYATIFILIPLIGCSSVNGDAKKAAELNKKSLDYIKEQDLEEAEKAYKESQDIVSRYKGTEQYEEFHEAYNSYMLNWLLQK